MERNTIHFLPVKFIITSTAFARLLKSARPFQRFDNTLSLKDGHLSISGSAIRIMINDQHGEGSVDFSAKKLNRLYTILNNISEQPLVVTLDNTLELSIIYI